MINRRDIPPPGSKSVGDGICVMSIDPDLSVAFDDSKKIDSEKYRLAGRDIPTNG